MVLLDSVNVPFRANQSLQDDGISYRIGMHEWQDVVRVLDHFKIISTKCEPKTKPLKNSNGRKLITASWHVRGEPIKIFKNYTRRSRPEQNQTKITASNCYSRIVCSLSYVPRGLSSPLIHKSYLFLLFSQDRHRASLNLGPL